MNVNEVMKVLAANRAELARFHVRSLRLFGSVARGEGTSGSDVDLLVDFEQGARISLFRFVELKALLEQLLGCRVDLGTSDVLRPRLRERILREAIRVA